MQLVILWTCRGIRNAWICKLYIDGLVLEKRYSLFRLDGLVQEKRNSIANAMELRLSCINVSNGVMSFLH